MKTSDDSLRERTAPRDYRNPQTDCPSRPVQPALERARYPYTRPEPSPVVRRLKPLRCRGIPFHDSTGFFMQNLCRETSRMIPASRRARNRSGARTPRWKLTTFGFSWKEGGELIVILNEAAIDLCQVCRRGRVKSSERRPQSLNPWAFNPRVEPI